MEHQKSSSRPRRAEGRLKIVCRPGLVEQLRTCPKEGIKHWVHPQLDEAADVAKQLMDLLDATTVASLNGVDGRGGLLVVFLVLLVFVTWRRNTVRVRVHVVIGEGYPLRLLLGEAAPEVLHRLEVVKKRCLDPRKNG